MDHPLLRYPGAKFRITDWIISLFPQKFTVYAEPFGGGASVLLNKEPSDIEVYNDLDDEVYNFFKVLRDNPEELARVIDLTPYSRHEYLAAYETAQEPLERARRFAVRCHQSFAASQHRQNSWRCGVAPTSPNPAKKWAVVPDEILQIKERFKNVQLENSDACYIINKYNNADTFIYLDPPYLPQTRTCKLYKFEMTPAQHEELLKLCMQSKSKIMISGYDSELYNRILKGWRKESINSQSLQGGLRHEVIWMNYYEGQLKMF